MQHIKFGRGNFNKQFHMLLFPLGYFFFCKGGAYARQVFILPFQLPRVNLTFKGYSS